MDVDDDDAFLYGAQSPPPAVAPLPALTTPEAASTSGPSDVANGLSASMAASLAAYGIDPTAAVAAENPEDGGVEEEDPEDEDSDDDDEDDVKLVFSGQATRLDLRKPQTSMNNVIGIGKWAHTATGTAPAPATPATPQYTTTTRVSAPVAITNQTTEYNPAPRPSATPNPLTNPPIPPTGDGSTAPSIALPPSSLPPVTAPSSHPVIDPTNPSGVIPSSGQSVYEIDLAQFEGSGQLWRRPGSDLADWFNFGFDEVTYPKYLRYGQDMEAGRNALMNLPMGAMPPDVANLLHMNMGSLGGMGMNVNANMPFHPQQMQAMQQMMGVQGMDGMMPFAGMQGMPGMGQMQMGGMQGMGMGMGQGVQQGMMPRPVPQVARPSATPAPVQPSATPEAGEEVVKQEDGVETGAMDGAVPEPQMAAQGAFRGRGMVPLRGVVANRVPAMRGRGTAVPVGPRAGVGLPANIPKGPKAGRFKDKDRVEPTASGGLDYGGEGVSSTPSGSSSPVKSEVKTEKRSSRRERDHDYDFSDDGSRDRSKERSTRWSSRKEDEKDRDGKREKRKRDDGTISASLGPGGWESESDEERRSSRRRRSESSSEERHRSARKRR